MAIRHFALSKRNQINKNVFFCMIIRETVIFSEDFIDKESHQKASARRLVFSRTFYLTFSFSHK